MILSIEAIKDYQYCPRMFKYNYIKAERPSKFSTIDKFSAYCLFKTFEWFFYNIQDEKIIPSFGNVKKKFGELYSKNRTVAETLFMSTAAHNKARALENRSIEALRNFYNRFYDDMGYPLIIGKQYQFNVNGVTVIGNISVIRENTLKKIELMTFYPDHLTGKTSGAGCIPEHDINTIGASIAFKNIYGSYPDVHKTYAMFTNKELITKVDGISHKNFDDIVTSVGKAVSNNLYYPVYNDHCLNCAYRNKCTKEW